MSEYGDSCDSCERYIARLREINQLRDIGLRQEAKIDEIIEQLERMAADFGRIFNKLYVHTCASRKDQAEGYGWAERHLSAYCEMLKATRG